MKEHPIIFSGPMVRAILDGRKTQTRWVVREATDDADGPAASMHPTGTGIDWVAWWPNPVSAEETARLYPKGGGFRCPYGIPGDRRWVRETFRLWLPDGGPDWSCRYRSDSVVRHRLATWEEGDQYESPEDVGLHVEPSRWQPSIHMPRWASRITLEVTGVQVQRLREISDQDAKAEGCPGEFWKDGTMTLSPIAQFLRLWDSLNGKKPGHDWASNPWVWVIGFRVVKE